MLALNTLYNCHWFPGSDRIHDMIDTALQLSGLTSVMCYNESASLVCVLALNLVYEETTS